MPQRLFELAFWESYALRAAQGLLLAIPIALLFELAGWLARRWVLKRLAPTFNLGIHHDPAARARRKRSLHDLTIAGLRWLFNGLALVAILTLWHLDPVAAAVLVGSLVILAQPVWRDLLAGYTLLLDDCLAPGDEVVINDQHRGTVTQLSLRGVRLKVGEAEHLWIRNGEVRSVASRIEPAPAVEERP